MKRKIFIMIVLGFFVAGFFGGCQALSKKQAAIVKRTLKANINDFEKIKKGETVNLDLSIRINQKSKEILEKIYGKEIKEDVEE